MSKKEYTTCQLSYYLLVDYYKKKSNIYTEGVCKVGYPLIFYLWLFQLLLRFASYYHAVQIVLHFCLKTFYFQTNGFIFREQRT